MDLKMLSRAGKSTDERYMVLKKKDEILGDKRKTFVVKSKYMLPKQDAEQELIDRVRFLHNKKMPELQPQLSAPDLNLQKNK